jgi:hypothetical protein
MTVYFSKDTPLDPIFEASNESWGNHPTAITVMQVHALGREGALVGIEAVALLP